MEMGKLIGQGRTAEIFALDDRRVLKLFRADMAHKSVEKEFALGKLIAETGVPAPEVYEMVSVEGRRGIIYQMVAGKTMLEYIARKPFAVMAQARKLARLHQEIHKHTVSGLPSQKEIIRANINRVDLLSAPDRDDILRHLHALPQGGFLCHGDFHPDNVMVSHREVVVLDWMNASIGCPAADVARTVLLLRDAAPPPGIAGWKAGLLSLLRKSFYFSYTREYYRISEVTSSQVKAWMLPVAAARLAEDLPQSEKQLLTRIIRELI